MELTFHSVSIETKFLEHVEVSSRISLLSCHLSKIRLLLQISYVLRRVAVFRGPFP